MKERRLDVETAKKLGAEMEKEYEDWMKSCLVRKICLTKMRNLVPLSEVWKLALSLLLCSEDRMESCGPELSVTGQ